MIGIETARLLLRPFTPENVEALHAAVYGDADVMTYMPGGRPRTLEQTRRVIEYFLDHWQTEGYGVWAVAERDQGDLIGQCGLNFVPEIQQTEVLYALAKPAWGRGYATEAAHAALRYGFNNLGLSKIVALAAEDNRASQHVMAKLGMKYRRVVDLWSMKLQMYALPRDKFVSGNAPYRLVEESRERD